MKYSTRELKVEFDISSFLSTPNSKISIDSLKLVDADAVFQTSMSVLKDFNLDESNLIYLMTDNCPAMRGNQKGFVKQMSEHCPNLLTIDGCGCHKMNLLQKDAIRTNKVADIITFAERLSNFLENKPKIQSILHHYQQLFGLTRISDYCPTRFLSLFYVLVAVCDRYDLLKKIVSISQFLVNLDQFMIHSEPLCFYKTDTISEHHVV